MANLTVQIPNKTITKWFYAFCSFHFLLWFIIPSLVRRNLRVDSLEALTWGRMWQMGYNKHPPFSAWLTTAFTDFFGTVGWPVYLLSQISVIACFWAVWKLGNRFLQPVHTFIGIVMLEGIYYYTVASPQFNPNVPMLGLWALTILCFYHALLSQKWRYWFGVGVFAGLAMISKYESGLLYGAMLLTMLLTQQGRASFRRSGVYLAIIVGFLIFLPNLIWLFHHHFIAVTYADHRIDEDKLGLWSHILDRILHPLDFTLEQLGALAPMLLFYLPFYRTGRQRYALNYFDKRFLVYMALGPSFCILLFSIILGAWLHALWAFPLFSLIGILWVGLHQPVVTPKRLHIFIAIAAVIMVLTVCIRFTAVAYWPYFTGKTFLNQFPGQIMAQRLTKLWHQRYHRPVPYVAGARYYVENISVFSPDRPEPFFEWSTSQSAWINPDNVRKKGAIFAWRAPCGKLPQNIAKQYPGVVYLPPQKFKYLTNADIAPLTVCVALLPPASLTQPINRSDKSADSFA